MSIRFHDENEQHWQKELEQEKKQEIQECSTQKDTPALMVQTYKYIQTEETVKHGQNKLKWTGLTQNRKNAQIRREELALRELA